MRNICILIIFGLAILFLPLESIAKTFCFEGGDEATGSYFYLTGGKVDQKPFSGYWVVPNMCSAPAWATIIKDSAGDHIITINTVHDADGNCLSFWFHGSGETVSFMSGEYDLEQDGTLNGTFSLGEMDCSDIPAPASIN